MGGESRRHEAEEGNSSSPQRRRGREGAGGALVPYDSGDEGGAVSLGAKRLPSAPRLSWWPVRPEPRTGWEVVSGASLPKHRRMTGQGGQGCARGTVATGMSLLRGGIPSPSRSERPAGRGDPALQEAAVPPSRVGNPFDRLRAFRRSPSDGVGGRHSLSSAGRRTRHPGQLPSARGQGRNARARGPLATPHRTPACRPTGLPTLRRCVIAPHAHSVRGATPPAVPVVLL